MLNLFNCSIFSFEADKIFHASYCRNGLEMGSSKQMLALAIPFIGFSHLSLGLSVVYLSGRKGPGGPGCYSQDDVDALRALAEEPGIVDLFLTYPFFFLWHYYFLAACVKLRCCRTWILKVSSLVLSSLDDNEIALMNGLLEWWMELILLMHLLRYRILMDMIL